jgi:ribosomal protein L11 methylase PrmA
MLAARHGWTYQIHHTDKPATDALRALMVRLSPGQGSPGQGSAATNLGA